MSPLPLSSSTDAKLPAPERLFLLITLMISGTVTLPQVIPAGMMSGLGLWTIVAGGLAWGLWLMKPRAPRALLPILIPLAAFTGFAALSPLWGVRHGNIWIQLLAVTVGFLGFVLLTAREVAGRPAFADHVLRATDFASVTAAVGYTLTFLAFGPGGDAEVGSRPVFLARPFALFAIVAVARQLGRFHAGERAGLVVACWLTALVFVSQSRLGMVTILLLFPASFALVGGRRNVELAIMMLVAGVGGLAVLLATSDEMYQRFFGYDASLEVGGVAINASGRTAAWEAMIADIRTPMQLAFGSGAGAGSTFVSLRFVNLPHPHNDYLRYLYDFGLFGLSWFLAFAAAAVVMLWNRLRAARAMDDRPAVGLPLGTLLALLGVLVSMLTDNSANYIYVMAPLAILLGASLCRPVARPTDPELDWVFREATTRKPLPAPLPARRRRTKVPTRPE